MMMITCVSTKTKHLDDTFWSYDSSPLRSVLFLSFLLSGSLCYITKVGGNYAAAILPAQIAAQKHGCAQVLWLFGADHQVTEVGAMNIFFVLKKKDGSGIEVRGAD